MAISGWRAYKWQYGLSQKDKQRARPSVGLKICPTCRTLEPSTSWQDWQDWQDEYLEPVPKLFLRPLTRVVEGEDLDMYPHIEARCGAGWWKRWGQTSNGVGLGVGLEDHMKRCSCGHYAYNDPRGAIRLEENEGHSLLLAQVDAYGKVVHCTHHYGSRGGKDGWRAQFVKVQSIVAPTCWKGCLADTLVLSGCCSFFTCASFHTPSSNRIWSPTHNIQLVPLLPLLADLSNRLDCDILAPDSSEIGVIKNHLAEAERRLVAQSARKFIVSNLNWQFRLKNARINERTGELSFTRRIPREE